MGKPDNLEAGARGRADGGEDCWYREWHAGALLLLVLGIYFVRLGEPPLRGEESRRGQVAVEMRTTGDWIVPRQQGQPFFSRPPLQNWAIAWMGCVRGGIDEIAIRLPSALSILLTSLLIYAYSRSFLTPLGAFSAGAAFATMVEVLKLGRSGETEALFTLLVAASLLVWHHGFTRGWPALGTWVLAYAFVALGTLTKGPQAPFYFVGGVGLFLALRRQWRFAFSWQHALGIVTFLLIWGVWQVPYVVEMGFDASRRMYFRDVGLRFNHTSWTKILGHVASYPLEVFACMLPWSVFLLAFVNRGFLRLLGPARGYVLFIACCLLVSFPPVWLAPESKTRYFMPLYPCLAILIGLVVERCLDSRFATSWKHGWHILATVMAIVMFGAGAAVLGLTVLDDDRFAIGLPLWSAILYAAVAGGLSGVALLSRRSGGALRQFAGVLAIALFIGLTYVGVFTNISAARAEDTQSAVVRLKRALPADARLVSFGFVDHLFAYYYGRPIEYRPRLKRGRLPDKDVTYFCSGNDCASPIEAAFPHVHLGTISCERHRLPNPGRVVVVGRYLPSVADGAAGKTGHDR